MQKEESPWSNIILYKYASDSISVDKLSLLIYNHHMETKYYGWVLGNFPLFTFIVTNQPRIIRDIQADYGSERDFKASPDQSTPAHQTVAFGLLGIKIPLKK